VEAPERRGAIDVVRVGALVLVVLGHLTLAVVDRGPDGALRGANLLALHPNAAWLAMLAPMPLFFAAAGWANATATSRSAAPRLRTLVGLGAVVVVVWSVASIVELLIRGEGGIVADGARIATQPLWFLAAYIPFTAWGARMAGLARRPALVIGVCLAALAALDIARFAFDAPEAIGWPGFLLAWGTAWLAGAWWRQRWEAGGMPERRIGAVLAIVSSTAAIALVLFAGYHPALIDAVEGQRSNTTPPTLYTAVAALVQVGLLMMVAAGLDRLAARWRRQFDKAGTVALGVYVWHLTALALCAAVLAAGLWAPGRFTTSWWLSRPLWIAAVLGVTGLLVAATAAARTRLQERGPRGPRRRLVGISIVRAGLVLSTFGAAVVGLVGPRTLPGAIAAIVGFTLGWWWLGGLETS